MDLSSLKSLAAYRPSLTDFLSGGQSSRTSHFDTIANSLLGTAVTGAGTEAASSIDVNLSEEAKALMEAGLDGDSGQLSGVQKSAQNFLISFFDQSGLDLSKLSEDTLKIIVGLQDVIAGSAATGRDLATDTAEEKYAGGNKKVYTMVGNGTRLRIAIDYKEGQPQKLSITDITGGAVETADITIQNGKLVIDRTQREYVNGHMTSFNESETLDVALYAA